MCTLKKSMFNFFVYDENLKEIIGYNSYRGIESITIVDENKSNKVLSWLNAETLRPIDDKDFKKMCEKGFFVDEKIDERANRDLVIMENILDSKLHLLIDTTTVCNFRCQYCADPFEKCEKMPESVQMSIVEFVRKNIGRYTAVSVDWFGGEPLLGLDVIENLSKQFIDICGRAKKPYSATITTNGYYLNPINIGKLLKMKVFSYTVTVDGLKDTHDGLRVLANGLGTYDTILGNLKYIRDNVKNRYVKIVIRTNITKEILENIENYYLYMDNEFGGDSRFTQLFRLAGDWGGERVKKISNSLLDDIMLADAYMRVSRITNKFKCLADIFYLQVGGASCRSTKKNRYAINVKGEVSKCENTSPHNIVGKIDDCGNMYIDYSKEAVWTCGHRIHAKSLCRDCALSMTCFMSPCPAAYVQNRYQHCDIVDKIAELLLLASKTLNVTKL